MHAELARETVEIEVAPTTGPVCQLQEPDHLRVTPAPHDTASDSMADVAGRPPPDAGYAWFPAAGSGERRFDGGQITWRW